MEFSRLEYRRASAWPRRIQREGPYLERRLAEAPPRGLVVDLGCGSGEHVRHLASRGCSALGIDRSMDAMELAREATEAPGSAVTGWVRGDLRKLPLEAGSARLALCLGNTLAILGDDADILEAFREVRRVLLPGGLLVLQVLNYHRLRQRAERWLPLNFRLEEDPEGTSGGGGTEPKELVYLRLMDFDEPEHVSFHTVTLERSRRSDAVRVRRSVRRRLRTIEFDRVAELLRAAEFEHTTLHGDYEGAPFDPLESTDVIAVAR